ncbi:MAG: murein biosynthesis integral membrane protein MurJ, partial [Rhodospirillaceae bacterium]|nr:murein biosynthesis integral membrane protein MurJ [Rhodospirillaceae bacterium]
MKLLRSSAVVAFWTLASRILGFIRDILLARYLGAVGVVEAFIVAFRFPNMFRRLVAEGAFAAAFVPLFSKQLERDGKERAMLFADQVFSVLVLILTVFTVFAEVFMPQVLLVVAPGFSTERPELFDTAVLLARLTLPYLLCMAIVAMMSGMLNSSYRFAAAAAAPILLNVTLILGLLFAKEWFTTPAHMLAWGVTISGIGQYLWLAWSCRRVGLDLRLRWPKFTPAIRRLIKLMVPGLISGGMTQMNILIGTIIGTFLTGVVTYIHFADRVYQFPLGMVGIAIGTALLPELSRTLQTDKARANTVLNRAIELAMLLILPATAALVVIALPIITVMYQYGRFTAEAAELTAGALAVFATGLPAFVLIKVLSPAFFARHDTRSPMIYAIISMVVNIVLSPLLVWPLGVGYLGIPIATSVAAWINTALLAWFLVRRGHLSPDDRLRRVLPRLALASL